MVCLTGSFIDSEVVWYNNVTYPWNPDRHRYPSKMSFMGFLLILMNIAIMEWLEERAYYKKK